MDLVLDEIPSDPAAASFRLGKTLGADYRHWRRAKFLGRFRLFFRCSSAHKVIVYAWINDESTLRKAGSRSDPYAVFEAASLSRGEPPDDWAELMREAVLSEAKRGEREVTVSAVDSRVYGGLFTTKAMREVFGDEARLQRMLDVEAALARAEAKLGLIPAEAAAGDHRQGRGEALRSRCDPGRDRARGLSDHAAGQGAQRGLRGRCRPLRALGGDHPGHRRHRARAPDPGRARADRAPISPASRRRSPTWPSAIAIRRWPGGPICSTRCRSPSASNARPGWPRSSASASGSPSCGAGCWWPNSAARSARSPRSARTASGSSRRWPPSWGCAAPPIAWHVGARPAGRGAGFLGVLTGCLGKIATDVMLLMQTEVGEVREPYLQGRGGSSTMPQKRNPIACEFILAAAANVRQLVPVMLDAHARRPRARDRPLACRVDRTAAGVRADRGRLAPHACDPGRARGRSGAHAAQSRCSPAA